jgi:hypothetical protein|tara:strand:+ start:1913 stop:2131 length:219 start_codon:yes stop_codon:yes gene_type:complete
MTEIVLANLLDEAGKLRPLIPEEKLLDEIVAWPRLPHEFVAKETPLKEDFTNEELISLVKRWILFHTSHPSG